MNKIFFDIIVGMATGQLYFWLGYLTKSAIINRNRKQAQKEPVVPLPPLPPLPPCNISRFSEAEKGAEFHEKTLGGAYEKAQTELSGLDLYSNA